jgi:hypothetical protein
VDNGLNDENLARRTAGIDQAKLEILYTVHESVAPPGYRAGPDQTVTLHSSAKVTLTFVNSKPNTRVTLGASAPKIAAGGQVTLIVAGEHGRCTLTISQSTSSALRAR